MLVEYTRVFKPVKTREYNIYTYIVYTYIYNIYTYTYTNAVIRSLRIRACPANQRAIAHDTIADVPLGCMQARFEGYDKGSYYG